jgi:hypothetical protein
LRRLIAASILTIFMALFHWKESRGAERVHPYIGPS